MTAIEIIGAGIVGFATGFAFKDKGLTVRFVETDQSKRKALRKSGFDAVTPSAESRQNVSAHFICVPTPTIHKRIDLSYLISATESLARRIKRLNHYSTVVVKSTVVPGTTEGVVLPILEKISGKRVKKDFGLCVNPEYLRSKTAVNDAINPQIILVGQSDKKSGDSILRLYNKFDCPKYRLSLTEAEFQKYIHNTYNANKISFFNEMRIICRKLNIPDEKILFETVSKSAEGFWNARYGLKNSGPFAGNCLPKDTLAFATWAEEQGINLIIVPGILKQNRNTRNRL